MSKKNAFCAWPGCHEQALGASGNFGGELVCCAHFAITNGGQALVGAEEHTHFHKDGSKTVTRSALGSLEEIFVRHIEAGERRKLREACHGPSSVPAFDEVLEGLRGMREDVGPEPRGGAEQVRDETALDRAIGFLESLPESAKKPVESAPYPPLPTD